jgi:uncharacterized MAPEG superfamily protein
VRWRDAGLNRVAAGSPERAAEEVSRSPRAVSGRPPHGLARRLVGTLVNQRASFEFVVTEACLRKVVGRAALARSIERRRHQAPGRRTHYQQQRRTLH